MKTSTAKQKVTELEAAGWTKFAPGIWRSPNSVLYAGTDFAYKMLKSKPIEPAVAEEAQRFMLVSDDDGHNYVILTSEEKAFDKWVDATCSGDYDYEGQSFDDKRLSGSVRRLTFLDPREE